MISVIIPTYKDRGYLEKCLGSVMEASRKVHEKVEVIPIFNYPSFGKANACNLGYSIASGNILVFLDADCTISKNFLQEVSEKAKNNNFVGGGTKWVKLDRYSSGIISGMILLAFYLLIKRVTVGAFWIRKEIFKEIGGFIKDRKYYDISFALRLKKYAKKHHKKFESLKESYIVWSTRKFGKWGDWHWIRGYRTERLGN